MAHRTRSTTSQERIHDDAEIDSRQGMPHVTEEIGNPIEDEPSQGSDVESALLVHEGFRFTPLTIEGPTIKHTLPAPEQVFLAEDQLASFRESSFLDELKCIIPSVLLSLGPLTLTTSLIEVTLEPYDQLLLICSGNYYASLETAPLDFEVFRAVHAVHSWFTSPGSRDDARDPYHKFFNDVQTEDLSDLVMCMARMFLKPETLGHTLLMQNMTLSECEINMAELHSAYPIAPIIYTIAYHLFYRGLESILPILNLSRGGPQLSHYISAVSVGTETLQISDVTIVPLVPRQKGLPPLPGHAGVTRSLRSRGQVSGTRGPKKRKTQVVNPSSTPEETSARGEVKMFRDQVERDTLLQKEIDTLKEQVDDVQKTTLALTQMVTEVLTKLTNIENTLSVLGTRTSREDLDHRQMINRALLTPEASIVQGMITESPPLSIVCEDEVSRLTRLLRSQQVGDHGEQLVEDLKALFTSRGEPTAADGITLASLRTMASRLRIANRIMALPSTSQSVP